MWIDNLTYLEDLNNLIKDKNIPWTELDGKTIFVTGATGLIGQNIVNALLYYGMAAKNPPKVIALVRNIEKANNMFAQQLKDCGKCLEFVVSDITDMPKVDKKIDYMIHGASQTASSAFVEKPVETIDIAITGTKNMLEIAKRHNVESFVYLSSMEAYGAPHTDELLKESEAAYFDSMSVRSCYPESKRMCESLCCAYANEYDVNTKAIRLAQTFGLGVSKEDTRVFAEFARRALEGQDIVLLTKGESKRMYLYTMDAVSAIITILLKGEKGQCYNAANKETYCSVKEMAELVKNALANDNIKVITKCDDNTAKKYPPAHKLNLDTSKLELLGWKATVNLKNMYLKMISDF